MGCNCGNKSKEVVPTVVGSPELCSCGKPKTECGKCNCGCEAKPCVQEHETTLVESVYTTTVEVTHSWAMPAPNDCVQLHLKDVVNILPGAILWNKSVGSLTVSSYDASTGYVLACNGGEDGNAEEGTAFPSCMSFHIGIPVECNCDDGYDGVCLASDMISPGEGETTEVSVTTVSGLFIGDIIDIAGYMYRITAITDIHTITVKNEGFGAPIGTVIKNDPNCTGRPCTVKITVVNSDDPCIKEPVNEGVLLVCEDGERKPFEGTADSQIAVWDNNDKKWKLQTVKIEDECTNTTVDVTLEPLVSLYIITVEKTSIFNVNDIVYFAGHKCKVNSIVNSTQMRIEVQDTISGITVIEEGESICLGDCCEMIEWPEKYSYVITEPNGSITNVDRDTTGFTLENTTDRKANADPDNVETHPNQSFSSTITITTPFPGKNVTLLGTISIQYKGVGIGDTHFQGNVAVLNSGSLTVSGRSNAVVYHVPPRVCLSGNVNITTGGTTTKLFPTIQDVPFYSRGVYAGTSTRSVNYGKHDIDGLYTYDAFYSTPVNYDGFYEPYPGDKTSTDGSATPVTQSIILPISLTLNGSNTTTLTITGDVMLLNARGKLIKKDATSPYDDDDYFTNEEVKLLVKETTIATSLAWILQ